MATTPDGSCSLSAHGLNHPVTSLVGAPIVLIEQRALFRSALARAIADLIGSDVTQLADVGAWREPTEPHLRPALVVVGCAGASQSQIEGEIRSIKERIPQCPIVIIADGQCGDEIISALRLGVKGYVSTATSIEVTVEALRLVRAGGEYAPVSRLIASRGQSAATAAATDMSSLEPADEYELPSDRLFTPRQRSVVHALRQGKPNKVIAYELDMCESTVKVHVRSIMKKLNAKNRTEVAYIANRRVMALADD